MKNFEKWWEEADGRRSAADFSLKTLEVLDLTKKLCQQAFEAGQEYEKQKINPVEIDGIKKEKCGTIES